VNCTKIKAEFEFEGRSPLGAHHILGVRTQGSTVRTPKMWRRATTFGKSAQAV